MMIWLESQFVRNGWVDHWQTLIAGALAIAAALLGGIFILKQINATREMEAESRRRKFDAARAIFPLTLSSLIEYSRACIRHLLRIYASKSTEIIPKTLDLATPPILPSDAIGELRILIEHAGQPFGDSIRILLTRLQIQAARLSSLVLELRDESDETLVTASNIETYLIDAVEIYARTEALFAFARGETDEVPGGPNRADMSSSLRKNGLWDEQYPRLYENVGRLYK